MSVDLNSPLVLSSGITLPNRMIKASLSEKLADPDGKPNAALMALYKQWAAGGAAALFTGHVMIDPTAVSEPGNVVFVREHLAELREWAKLGNIWPQLNHPGRQIPKTQSHHPVAPSAVAMKGSPGIFATPRALTEDEIRAIIQRFADAAALAKEAGFGGVQIHAAHGYLLSQFLSPLVNLRAAPWGGSPENRRRMLLETVRAVKDVVGPNFPVAVKLNSADFQRGGFTEEESMAVVDALQVEGIDLLEISGGSFEAMVVFKDGKAKHESSRSREAFFLDYAEKLSKRVDLPLMVTGGFRTAEGMRFALQSGACALVGLGRPLILEPDLPKRLLAGEATAAIPVRLDVGIQSIDTMIHASWYQAQLRRMSQGQPPEPGLWRLPALASLTWSYLFDARAA